MPNQRVVVLTSEEIGAVLSQYKDGNLFAAETKLRAALEHPEGITDDLTRRIESALFDPAQFCARGEGLIAYGEPMDSWRARAVVAALFPGER